jgi:hypothetical protein
MFVGIHAVPGREPADEATPGAMKSYKSGAGFDPAGRVFHRGDVPVMITSIHAEYVKNFLDTPGFGGGRRMVVMTTTPPAAWTELVPDSEGNRAFDAKRSVSRRSAGEDRLDKGYDPVHESMKLKDGTIKAVKEQIWRMEKQELMSVNAAGGPVVYLINPETRHALMKANKEFRGETAKKRELTEFETAALKKLRDGDDVVLQSSEKEMHVLGAVRAREECLTCHKVEAGTLLGAFTYKLALQSQETPAKDRLKDTAGLSKEEISAVITVESTGGKVTREKGGAIRELNFTRAPQPPLFSEFVSTPYVRLRDSALNVLSVFPDLKVLDVSNSLVTDEGLSVITKLKKLEKLDLRNTLVTGDGLEKIKKDLPNCQVRHHSTEPIQPPPTPVPPTLPNRG